MDLPLISVIVPVYNVEAYLDRCVQSIVDQTYPNLEIILVDDGSLDNCPAMCDAWAARDSRIKVIHKENGGLSDARNAGMAAASGAYMGFVDSDDFISADMYQLLYDRMIADGSDIAACGVVQIFEDGTPSRNLTPSGSCILNSREAMEAVIRESWLKQPVWYKLYRSELVRELPFPAGKYHEDVFWTWQAVARARSVSIFDTPCYYYAQRSGSIMAEAYSLRRLDAVEAKLQRQAYLKTAYPELTDISMANLLFTCMYHGQLALRDLDKTEQRIAFYQLKHVVKDCYTGGIGQSIVQKCWLLLARINLKLCCKIRNRLGVGL